MDEEFTTADLLEELAKYADPINDRRPGGVTASEYAEEFGISEKTAARILKELYRDGVLVRERIRVNRFGVGFCYYKNDDKSSDEKI